MTVDEILVLCFKLFLAVFLGGILGVERERKGQAAGLRTYIILTIGAMLAMVLSLSLLRSYPSSNVSQIPANVLSGIGFLGAGAILRFGFSVKGLTTAASLWSSAVIGLCIGDGLYLPALLTTLVVFFIIYFLDKIEKQMKYVKKNITLRIRFGEEELTIKKIRQILADLQIHVNELKYAYNSDKKNYSAELHLNLQKPILLEDIIDTIKKLPGINSVIVENEFG
jgi:putative Mg2+ transporter-C (MgtC) family protein